MKKSSIYNIVELLISVLFIGLGICAIAMPNQLRKYIINFIHAFIHLKIFLILFRGIMFKEHPLFIFIQIILHIALIVAMLIMFFNRKFELLEIVVASSVVIDFVINILRSILSRKNKKYASTFSFFGMENIIYLIFIILFFLNDDANSVASWVMFGSIVLYKGISLFLNNHFTRKLVNLTNFGQAVNKVHGLDVLFGLVIIVVLSAFIFPCIESGINNSGDALWYCFMLITSIGCGDIVATTVLGRILSVIIGFYGLIIISILTSAIVVFLTNTAKESNKKEETK